MTKYERLLQYAYDENIDVIEDNRLPEGFNGLYFHINNRTVIVIRQWLTGSEKTCVLVEELGHHWYSACDRRSSAPSEISRSEYLALRWATETAIPWKTLQAALIESRFCLYDCADLLDVTYSFLLSAIAHYDEKYHDEMTSFRRAALSKSAAV